MRVVKSGFLRRAIGLDLKILLRLCVFTAKNFIQIKTYLIIGVLPIVMFSCYSPNSQEVMQDLKAIKGKWESYEGVKFNENWRFVNDSLFEGEGFSMNGSDTSFYESLRIVKKGDSIFYSVGLEERDRKVDFLLTDASRNNWTFTNPENEFPSIINYEINDDTIILVSISNIRGNKEQFFYLKRK